MGCNCGGGRALTPSSAQPARPVSYSQQQTQIAPGYAQQTNPNPVPQGAPPPPRRVTRRTI